MKKRLGTVAAMAGCVLALAPAHAQQQPPGFEEFAAEGASVRDREAFEQQLEAFRNNPDQQQELLEQAQAALQEAEARSTELEDAFDENQLATENRRGELQDRLGPLNELFGVLSQVTAQAATTFARSPTNIEYPERIEFFNGFGERLDVSDTLPEIESIERLWFELLREATELGQIERWAEQRYVTADGQEATGDVVRVGAFNVLTDGAYLQHNPLSNTISALQRQPESRFVESTTALVNSEPGDGLVPVAIDQTGRVLGNIADRATWRDQIEFGGLPGYVIIALGIVGVLLALERLITLGFAGRKVRAQLQRDTPSDDNPLGRVMRVYEQNQNVDKETLELRLNEAILKETPALQRGILFIKIISVVAPLLGLLGTVVGMIQTFESITMFGTGDPSIMAGGISQALVTTQFGLIVAIPTVLLHTIVSGRSRSIIQVLQERSTGLVAEHAAKLHRAGAR